MSTKMELEPAPAVQSEPILPAETEPPDYEQYRALSSSAVGSVIVGLLGGFALLTPALIVVPLLGLMLAVTALVTIRRNREQMTGTRIALAGGLISAWLVLSSVGWHSFVYLTEVPEGYTRISYRQLDFTDEARRNGAAIPAAAMALDGQKVFIKGYVYPGSQKRGIKTFLLVRDKGDCCFGGDPKITDRVQVTLQDPMRLTFSTRLHNLAGVLRVAPGTDTVDAPGAILYRLEADHLK